MHSPETPDLPCYPPLSSRCEVDERGTRGFRAPHRWECLFKVKHCGIWFSHDLCVARPRTELVAWMSKSHSLQETKVLFFHLLLTMPSFPFTRLPLSHCSALGQLECLTHLSFYLPLLFDNSRSCGVEETSKSVGN